MKPTNKLIQTILASLSGAAVLLLACSSPAATFQWTNATTGTFVTAANWTNTASPFGNGVPVAGDTGVNNLPGSTATIGTGDSVTVAILQAQSGIFSVTDGDLTATTVVANGSNGTFSVSGGIVNLGNLQITANYGVISISGGTITATTDSRVAAANAVWNVSGGTLNLSKHTIGSAAVGNTNNVMTVSGNAVVTQNQGSGAGVNRELWIGGNNGGSGTLILKNNATWTSSAANGSTDVIIGRAASGTQSPVGVLTVQDNASLVVQAGAAAAKVIRMADISGTASGTVNLNGGSISTIGFQRISGTATINANGGKITALAAGASFFRNFAGTGGNNSINLQSGGLTFDTADLAVGITNVLSGAGGLTKLGGDTLTLSASNTYTGGTIISNGVLALSGAGSIKNSSAISINNSTLNVSAASSQLAFAGTLTLNDATLTATFANTNITVGTLGTGGATNVVNITTLPSISAVPATVRLIKYTTAAPGLVDGGNVLTTLGAILPVVGNPVGYLTNNVANSSIDLVLTSMVLAPVITKQPAPDSAYTNFFAHFSVELEATNSPVYQWRKGGTPLSNGGHYSGADTAVLKISNVSGADAASYDVVVTNVSGSVTSSPAALTLVAPFGYEAAAVAAGPVALYAFDDLGDPATNNSPAFDYAGDFDGVYGIAAQNGNPNYNIAGPRPSDGLPGFDATNAAARFSGFTAESHVTLPPLNLNTNIVTLTAWINPGVPAASAGIIFCRGGGTVAGLNFTGSLDGSGNRTLGYTWNNEGGTFGWNSQIAPTPGVWSFVALAITPTNATVYIFDATGLRASSQTHTHVNQSFSASTLIGEDGLVAGNRQFDGTVDGAAIYGKALTQLQLQAIYGAGSGVSNFPPLIWAQPVSLSRYEHQTAVFNAQASGDQPLSYQWKYFDGVSTYTDIVNGSRISGATGTSLAISNLALADAGNLVVIVTNMFGAQTSSPVTLTVNATVGPATNITTSVAQPSTSDWDTDGTWSLPGSATDLAGQYYGSTFIIQATGGLRTPNFGNPGTPTTAFFPGEELRVEGNGTFDPSLTNAGAIRIKGGNPSTVYFKKLVMAGGQISSILNSGWPAILTGEANVISNTVVWAADDTSPRSITIQSTLTGNGTIQYHAYNTFTTLQTGSSAALNIANANNPYTGTWNVELGILVGSASNALGTNTITVGSQGALLTTYNLNNPAADLILNGRMYLTQADTFRRVSVNGVQLNAGTYTYAQLATAYPTNFPATWVGPTGAESVTTASGSITVLEGAVAVPPGNIGIRYSGSDLQITWTNATSKLLEATNLLGPWITNTAATSPFTIVPGAPQEFFRLQTP
jgi:autotransporter-associated beta strand protein